MTILWTGERIQQYKEEKENEGKADLLRAESLFADKKLKEKERRLKEEEAIAFEQKKREIEIAKALDRKEQANKQQHISPLKSLET